MPRHSATPTYRSATATNLLLVASFDGGHLTSDGGLPWLEEADAALGICRAVASDVPE